MQDLSRFMPGSRRHAPADEQLRQLYQEGCGAWVGRTNCGAETAGFYTGLCTLRFQTYQGAWVGGQDHPDALYTVALCTRHGPQSAAIAVPNSQEARDFARRLMQDMAPDYVADQMRVCAEWLATWGRTLELGER